MSDDKTTNGGPEVVDGPVTEDGPTKAWTLPSGRQAVALRRLKGKHLLAGQRAVGGTDMSGLPYALVAQACRIDGSAITYEDVLEMDVEDVTDLLDKGIPKKAAKPLPI